MPMPHTSAMKPIDSGGDSSSTISTDPTQSHGPGTCGSGKAAYTPSINIGCVGRGNAIMDALFALIRFFSYGVGLVIVASLIYAGIQYSASRGDPQATAKAVSRIRATVGALVLFIFGFTIVNYVVPAGILK
ncbi:MAG: hypothetical protein JWN38_686 [Candidatus Saccharibacteria bacterium]|nr:hypothetical protein [Candidatus Saccharibacteria bacterium]